MRLSIWFSPDTRGNGQAAKAAFLFGQIAMITRCCSVCGEEKAIEEFESDKRKLHGKGYRCKVCRNKQNAKWRAEYIENWHTEYPDYYKEWHTEHPNYYKEWRAKHPGYYAAMSREWRLEHPNYHAQWCVENKEKVRHYSRKRDKRLKDADGSYTLDEWNNLIEKYEYKCLRCGTSLSRDELTVDHIIPISKQGTNYISNIQPLCQSCNSWKHARYIDFRPDAYWADWT